MKKYLLKLTAGESLEREETREIMLNIAAGAYNEAQIAGMMLSIQTRGVTVDEMLGFRDGLLETGKYVNIEDYNTIDIVGTGGDGKNTFNISTCASFVVAGAGYQVTKHGNYSSTSVSGSTDVLVAHGMKPTDDRDKICRALDEAGIAYLQSNLFAMGMKNVAPVRKALGVPTCFNMLGPFVNPVHPKNSLHGCATEAQVKLYTEMHKIIGDNYGVITSVDGYDEISLTSGFKICTNNFEKILTPVDLGFKYIEQSDIFGGDSAAEAAKIFDNVLEGTASEAQTNVVIANAACAISVMDKNLSIADSVTVARESLVSGKALAAFKKFLEIYS